MNRKKWIILCAALALMGGTAALLSRVASLQKLGTPAVKTHPLPGSNRLEVELPEFVLNYTSEPVEVQQIVRDVLPPDTSFGQRRYRGFDGTEVLANVVLMGADRTSLHKPQICLRGTGWTIDTTEPVIVSVERPTPYDLPVMKLGLVPEKPGDFGGRRGLYVYWFAADREVTRDHWRRMWWMFRDLATTGVLQRWAYISYFTTCAPGDESATFERLKKLISASVPEFQRSPEPAITSVAAGR